MVKAILENRKTQTRRALNIQPTIIRDPFPTTDDVKQVFRFKQSTGIYQCLGMTNLIALCPYGVPGDRLYVCEEHYRFGHWEQVVGVKTKKGGAKWQFIADTAETIFDPPAEFRKSRHRNDPSTPAWHKRLARFMPKAISRTMLEITGVRVERLKDISEADAIAEGIVSSYVRNSDSRSEGSIKLFGIDAENIFALDAKSAYELLWEKINGIGSWDLNPWVWVISFTRVE